MEKRTNAAARIFAAIALIGAVLIVVVVVSTATDTDSSSRNDRTGQQTQREKKPKQPKAATYIVQPEDTLTSIAAKTGVPVNQLIALNPDVDPQILIAGETLKLK